MPVALRKLHLGGTVAAPGWEVLNIQSAPWVDHVGQADDLSRFADNTFIELYASHVLEHLDYQNSLPRALAEWQRVLMPAGLLKISVPDLDVLCQLFSQKEDLSSEERFLVMRMMFGGHTDAHDYHHTGLSEDILTDFLRDAGFVDPKRVEQFGLFNDTSNLLFKGQAISLNMIARKPGGIDETAADNAALGHALAETGVDSTQCQAQQHPDSNATPRRPVGVSASWGRGYFTGIAYGAYSFREMAPNWIDFALLSQRQRPPRARDGSEFAYLELGSGMGVGLCLLAAAYPEGRFVGIDFHPGHIAHSQWLASELQLDNIAFHEADFLELAAHQDQLPFDGRLRFDYVVAHGILSWVSEPVRQALLALTGSHLKPGGAFYCSYNTFPGWLERTAFKALVDLERQRLGGSGTLIALEKANQTLRQLVDSPTGNRSALGRAFPQLADHLQAISNQQSAEYLCGEYGHDYWQPFYVGEVHRMAASQKLSYVASASLPENHLALLPDHLAAVIQAEADPGVQQALLDLAINQSFRRDLFVKGPMPLSRTAQEQQLALQRLRWIAPPSTHSEPSSDPAVSNDSGASASPAGVTSPETSADGEPIQTSLGQVKVAADRCRALETFLADQPASLGEIHQALGDVPNEVVVLSSLLLHAGRLGLDRGEAGEAAAERCRAVNQRLMELMQGGHNLGYLAAPFTGHGAQPFSVLDAFVLAGLQQGLEGEVLSSCVWMGMEAAGVEMRGPDGQLLQDPQQCMEKISAHIGNFLQTTLPKLKCQGLVETSNL